jgi:hypothetical protein
LVLNELVVAEVDACVCGEGDCQRYGFEGVLDVHEVDVDTFEVVFDGGILESLIVGSDIALELRGRDCEDGFVIGVEEKGGESVKGLDEVIGVEEGEDDGKGCRGV